MAKVRTNKFTPVAGEILAWVADQPELRLDDIRARLAERGITASRGEVSTFLARARAQDDQEKMLFGIATGAETCRKLDEAFAENPAPHLATLVQLFKNLIVNLNLNPETPPDVLDRAMALIKPVLEFAKLESKQDALKLAERRVAILEQRESKAREIIGDHNLTPEQQTAKFREIFGLAT